MPVDRRTFMRLAASGLVSATVPLAACVKEIEQYGTTSLPRPDRPLTSPDDWYFVSLQGVYEGDLSRYRVKIDGVVDNPLRLSLEDLRNNYEEHLIPLTLACVGNSPGGLLLSAAMFRGVKLSDVVRDAGLSSRATMAVCTGLEGFIATRNAQELIDGTTYLVYEMGDSLETMRPLPLAHGFPCRMLTPNMYGYLQPKWLDRIQFADDSGYHDVLRRSVDYFEGKMELTSGFSFPRDGVSVSAGEMQAMGYAFGDGRAIGGIEIRLDDGPWEPVEVVWNAEDEDMPPVPGQGQNTQIWCLWRADIDLTPGRHKISVRASYTDGRGQYTGRGFPYTGGAIHAVVFEARDE